MAKVYDEAYFDKWYRGRARVRTRRELTRKVAMVVGIAEHLLGRRLRCALDVGCGEGEWGVELRLIRPAVRYLGIDPSQYVIDRFGEERKLRRGSLSELDEVTGRSKWDLVICSDVLHYVADEEIEASIPRLALLTEGVAFVDLMTVEDEPTGDMDEFRLRPAAWYRQRFEMAGLVSLGMQCYAGPALSDVVLELEKGSAGS